LKLCLALFFHNNRPAYDILTAPETDAEESLFSDCLT
jgi:hypothetical protein